MTMKLVLAAVFCAAIGLLPASAQFGRVERTQAEIAVEEAQRNFDRLQARRASAEERCADGTAEACHELGELLRRGDGGPQDLAGAARAYRAGCDGDVAGACAGLAYLTVQGRGIAANPASARRLYERACGLGEVSSCGAYGNMLYTGTGGRKDTAGGTRHLTGACNKGHQWSCERMRELGVFDPKDNAFERLRYMRR
jgi:TPR repeat protein